MDLPPPPPKRRRILLLGLIIGVLVAAVVGLGAYIVLDDSAPTAVAASPVPYTPSPSSSPSPLSAPDPQRSAAEVTETFNGRDTWSKGERLSFAAVWIPKHSSDCRTHMFTYRGRTHGAFQSDCASWDPDFDILLFSVALKNETARPVRFNLRHFVLVTRDERSFGPVNVRSEAEYPPNFLPETTIIAPHSVLRGWITFDGRVIGVVPDRMSYIDGKQTLTQTYEGRHAMTYP